MRKLINLIALLIMASSAGESMSFSRNACRASGVLRINLTSTFRNPTPQLVILFFSFLSVNVSNRWFNSSTMLISCCCE